eukprot:g3589.t1
MKEKIPEKTLRIHAKYLGVETDEDFEHFRELIMESLRAPLPPKWQKATSRDGRTYYWHTETRKTIWEHPRDEDYREMIAKEMKKMHDNKKPIRSATKIEAFEVEDIDDFDDDSDDEQDVGGGYEPSSLQSQISSQRKRIKYGGENNDAASSSSFKRMVKMKESTQVQTEVITPRSTHPLFAKSKASSAKQKPRNDHKTSKDENLTSELEERLAESKAQIKELRSLLAEQRGKALSEARNNQRLQRKIEELSSSNDESKSRSNNNSNEKRVQKLIDENMKLRLTITDLENTETKLKERLKDHSNAIGDRNRMNTLEEENSSLEEMVAKLRNEVHNLKPFVNENETQRKEIMEQEKIIQKRSQANKRLNDNLKELRTSIEQKKNDLQNLQKEKEYLEQTTKSFEKREVTLKEDTERLKASLQSAEEEVLKMQQDKVTYMRDESKRNENLRSVNTKLQERIRELEESGELSKLRDELEKVRSHEKVVESELRKLKEQERHRHAREQRELNIRLQESQLKTKVEFEKILRANLEEKERVKVASNEQIKIIRERLVISEQDKEKRLKKAKEELSKSMERYNALKMIISKSQNQKDDLQFELATTKERLQAKGKEINTITETVEAQKLTIRELKLELEAKTREVAKAVVGQESEQVVSLRAEISHLSSKSRDALIEKENALKKLEILMEERNKERVAHETTTKRAIEEAIQETWNQSTKDWERRLHETEAQNELVIERLKKANDLLQRKWEDANTALINMERKEARSTARLSVIEKDYDDLRHRNSVLASKVAVFEAKEVERRNDSTASENTNSLALVPTSNDPNSRILSIVLSPHKNDVVMKEETSRDVVDTAALQNKIQSMREDCRGVIAMGQQQLHGNGLLQTELANEPVSSILYTTSGNAGNAFSDPEVPQVISSADPGKEDPGKGDNTDFVSAPEGSSNESSSNDVIKVRTSPTTTTRTTPGGGDEENIAPNPNLDLDLSTQTLTVIKGLYGKSTGDQSTTTGGIGNVMFNQSSFMEQVSEMDMSGNQQQWNRSMTFDKNTAAMNHSTRHHGSYYETSLQPYPQFPNNLSDPSDLQVLEILRNGKENDPAVKPAAAPTVAPKVTDRPLPHVDMVSGERILACSTTVR